MHVAKPMINRSLKDAMKQFRALQKLLMAGEVDEHLLRDFRAALNRVRNTAWGVQQYISQKETGHDAANLISILAVERIRAAYGLCQAIRSDLKKPEINFQAGNLVEFQTVIRQLGDDVGAALQHPTERP